MDFIYLSPSNQASNSTLGGYSGRNYAGDLCLRIQRILIQYSHTSCIIGESNQSPYDRPTTAKKTGCNLYIALNSGFVYNHCATGTVCFYHPENTRSINLANQFSDALTSLCPVESTDNEYVKDGMRIYGKLSLVEISKPHELGMTPVLIEVNFHDNPDTCRWMIDSIEPIAESISKILYETTASQVV